MPDYHSPTVVQPAVPLADASPFELLLLHVMFEAGTEDETSLDLASEYGIDHWPSIAAAELRQAIAESDGYSSQVMPLVEKYLDGLGAVADEEDVILDLVTMVEEPTHLVILQDIVRRSASIPWFTCVTAYTCTKMNSDGFGGRAALVAADLIRNRSTDDLIEEFIGEVKQPAA